MTRLRTIYHLSIAMSLLATITQHNNGKYQASTNDLYAICDKEVLELSNSFVKRLEKYRIKVGSILAEVKSPELAAWLIIDNLSAVIASWSQINNDKYNNYVKIIEKHLKKLDYYWRGMVDSEHQERAFEITDEIMGKLFKEVE